MNKMILIGMFLLSVGCSKSRSLEATVTATNGTSCSVSNELDAETSEIIGARISCTDGTYSVVLNGTNGEQGVQGPQGEQGIQGPVGQDGENGKSCQTYKTKHVDGVFLKCPGQRAVLIHDGKDGKSCSSVRQNHKKRVKITCGKNVSYVYDGKDGEDGQSCTVIPAVGGANVTCGNSEVFIANGTDGEDGLNGLDGEDAVRPGLSCNLHDLKSWNNSPSLPEVFASNTPVGEFTLANLSVPDSKASLGFPGMPQNLKNIVGIEGYALDCNGYINVPTSGVYTFKLLSDDGSRLLIEDNVIIENQGLHAPKSVTATVTLNRGQNRINVVYFQGPVVQIALELKWSGPNTSEQVVPTSSFTH